jgi:uncharacterized protein (TIGR02453 family)
MPAATRRPRATSTTGASSVAPAAFAGIPPAALTFLRGLARHNEKGWFEGHREAYERDLRAPMAALVGEMDARLGALAPELVGDRRRSLFRIHRDVRFSKDKRPYKTNAACWFFHRDVRGGATKDAGGDAKSETGAAVHAGAGFYFHLEPGQSFCGGGLWMPPRPALAAIRARIAERHEELAAIVRAPTFRRTVGELDREAMLVRLPRGYAADHPAAEWLRFQSFTAGRALTDDEATSAELPATLERTVRAMLPFVRWLNLALGLRPAERR